ncbi:MAG: AAA family ATPase [Mobilibacterium timonense]|uniref:ATP-binding protein n=3 Tax=Mobilibacterium timonense TaxID=1871012 RepID=UPI002352C1F5|nr:AAA family ATPase [Mobilibacterium timonense]MBM6991191.1 AAA family ATPase [Mobilibacterium timonense]
MNIKQAKEQVESAVRAYLTKDRYGEYVIPVESQRPVFLMGPPGIGKTAIMEQIAEEMNIALVSYSMTHHTRQSAIGLPFIAEKEYGGKKYHVSEYTMSEIIASMYEVMEETGKKEGILFLDEINCISETLAPSMLQFLQYKTFGRHRVPEGWVVVTAGNPPEYNDSVRDFDLVTWDRLKRIDVEPDLKVWKEYAENKGVHPLILSYLETKKEDFYSIETTVDGKDFVTARGWVDLSDMMFLLEKQGDDIDERLISQYIQNRRIAKSFAAYYDLFHKYETEYRIADILDGKDVEDVVSRAGKAGFDQRITVLGLLTHGIEEDTREIYQANQGLLRAVDLIRENKGRLEETKAPQGSKILAEIQSDEEEKLDKERTGRSISKGRIHIRKNGIQFLQEMEKKTLAAGESESASEIIGQVIKNRREEIRLKAERVRLRMSNLFSFVEKAFGTGSEMLILVTDLTESVASSDFISRYGCDDYFKYNRDLMFYERQYDISEQIDELDLDS